jgi:pilus assembly protein CpaF
LTLAALGVGTTWTLETQLAGAAGALLPLFADPSVTDILVNGAGRLFVEREGTLVEVPSPFRGESELFHFVERLCLPLGRRVDAAQPYLDGRLVDGSRFHVVLPPVASDGVLVSIRKARTAVAAPLEAFGPPQVVQWLREAVRARRNLLVVGATGAGKTTLLARLVEAVPEDERVLVVEESRELRPAHPHVIALEGRPPSPDGTGAVSLRALLKQALRMRPDRLVLGECRGEEAYDLLLALGSGHAGSLGTLHANGAREALRRLEALALLGAGNGAPVTVLREWIAQSVHAIVFVARREDGRKVREIVELRGMDSGVLRFAPLFGPGARDLQLPVKCAT